MAKTEKAVDKNALVAVTKCILCNRILGPDETPFEHLRKFHYDIFQVVWLPNKWN